MSADLGFTAILFIFFGAGEKKIEEDRKKERRIAVKPKSALPISMSDGLNIDGLQQCG